MMSAQSTPYSPAGNFLVYDPGITTLLAGTLPFISMGSEPAYINDRFVDCVKTTLAPNTASFSTITPSTTIQRDPMKQPSSMITGEACKGYTTNTNTTTQVNTFANLCTAANGSPGVNHGSFVHISANIHIAGHQYHILCQVSTITGYCMRNSTYA